MFLHQLSDADINYHNQRLRSDYASAQRIISIDGLRAIVGSTIIQIGSQIHGKAKDVCQEAEQRQISAQLIRGTEVLVK